MFLPNGSSASDYFTTFAFVSLMENGERIFISTAEQMALNVVDQFHWRRWALYILSATAFLPGLPAAILSQPVAASLGVWAAGA